MRTSSQTSNSSSSTAKSPAGEDDEGQQQQFYSQEQPEIGQPPEYDEEVDEGEGQQMMDPQY